MGQASGQRRRRIGRITALVLAGLLVVVTVLPLIVRGPVARWAVGEATASLCGQFEISGGHFGWLAIWQLALGRPTAGVLENVRVTGADGKVVFAAERLEATVELHLSPFRLIVSDVRMARGRLRLAYAPETLNSGEAFRSLPLNGRAGCLDPNAPRRRSKPSGGAAGSIALRNVTFEDVDVDLDFSTWELELARAGASGWLSIGGAGPPLWFEVRDVIAKSGVLRVGRRGEAWTARAPFETISIPRVGVTSDAPSDLQLEVASAATARARLTGQAAFRNIFPPRMNAQPPGPPGMEADVRWTGFGAALAVLDASWRPQGTWARHLDGDFHAKVQGPFNALEGALDIEGDGTRVAARVARGKADLALTFGEVDTAWMLDPALRPLLGGLLHGHLHATARLWPTFAGIEAEIPDADLRLDRRRVPTGPRRYQLRIGNGAHTGREKDTLYASVTGVRLAAAMLRLEGLRIDWPGLTARLDAHVAFAAQLRAAAPGEPAPRRVRSDAEAHGTLAVAALEDWIPGGAVTGPLHLAATAEGTIDRIAVGLVFRPPTAIGVLKQRFVLPPKIDAVLEADKGLDVPRFELRRVGGGTIQVGGRLGENGKVAAQLGLRDYPVAAIPGLDGGTGPERLAGTVAADVAVGGVLARPTIEGKLGVSKLALGSRPIGDVQASLHVGAAAGDVDATIDPGVTMHAHVRRRGALAAEATLALADRALGPWLPPPFTGAPLTATGDLKLALRAGAVTGEGKAHLTGPGLAGVDIEGEVHGLGAQGSLRGEIDLGRWPQLWNRALKSAAGAVAVDLTLTPALTPHGLSLDTPHLKGRVRVSRALTVQSRLWPSPLQIDAGGRIEIDGDAVSLAGIGFSTTGVRGTVGGGATLDRADFEQTRLALRLQAELDAAHVPVHLPDGVVAWGRAEIDAAVSGTLDEVPGPRLDGQARLDGLSVRLSPTTPVARASGVVEAHGNRLTTRGVRVEIARVGAVQIGRPGAPAVAELASVSPFALGPVDVPFAGENLKIGDPSSQLYIPDLDSHLRLTGDGRRDLLIKGEVDIAGASFDSSRGEKKSSSGDKPRVSGPWYHALPPHLTLDLDLRGSNKGMRVAVPVLPDVTVDFQCHLLVNNRAAQWSGHLRGDSTYARAAVAFADWLRDSDLRKCQLTP
jgi:hypothetical protein